jgi:WD40 repeat protein
MPLWVADGTRVFMQINHALYLWDATGKLIATISLQDDPQANVGVILAGEHIALPKQGNLLEIWDIVTGTKLRTISAGIRVGLVSWSLDGKYLAINDREKNGQIYNALTGQFLMDYQGDSASVSPNGKYIFTETSTDLQKIVRILPVL